MQVASQDEQGRLRVHLWYAETCVEDAISGWPLDSYLSAKAAADKNPKLNVYSAIAYVDPTSWKQV